MMRLEHSLEADWPDVPECRRDAIRDWLIRNGFTRDKWPIIGVRLVNEGVVELHCWTFGAHGQPGPPTFRTLETIAEPPPPEWWDDGGAS